jgi:hypothetical protein
MNWMGLALALLMSLPDAGLRAGFARTAVGLAATIRGRP